jgi:hypothetical protein
MYVCMYAKTHEDLHTKLTYEPVDVVLVVFVTDVASAAGAEHSAVLSGMLKATVDVAWVFLLVAVFRCTVNCTVLVV